MRPVRIDRSRGQGRVDRQRGEAPLRVGAEPVGQHQTQDVAVADTDRRTVRSEGGEAALVDDPGQVVDGVGRGEVERDARQRGQPPRGGQLRLPGGGQLQATRVEVGLHLEDSPVPFRPTGPLVAVPPLVPDVVGDVLGPLDDVAAGALGVEHRDADQAPEALVEPSPPVGDVVLLQLHGVDAAGVPGPLERAPDLADAAVEIGLVGVARKRLEHREPDDLVEPAAGRGEVRRVRVDDDEIGGHDEVGRGHRPEDGAVVGRNDVSLTGGPARPGPR